MPSPTANPSAPAAAPAPAAQLAAAPRRHRTRLLELPEVRWAAAALAVFLLALPLDLLGAPPLATGLLYGAVYALGGWEPALSGLKALKGRTLDVDLLMVVAALGAAAVGQPGDGALLIVIFAVSGALEAVATARTEDSVRGLLDLAPATATRLGPGGREEAVAAGDLAVGDTVLVRPGEAVGADGRVVDGRSEVDQATITGEALPADKAPGDEVYAGTLNGSGALTVRVGREAGDAVVARIAAMVEEASRTTSPTQRFIERIEQRYSIGMVAATIAVFAVPLAFGSDPASALMRAMTFMIVASPCAVVLSTMPPLLAAIANAGRHGVLVKSAEALERLAAADTVALDKTGTLTEGAPRVAEVRPLGGGDRASLLALAAAAERPSEHPIARAVVEAAHEEGVEAASARNFTSAPGEGVRAEVDGAAVAVGSPARLLAQDGSGPVAAREEARALEEQGRTAVVVLRDGLPVGVLGVADRVREGAAEAVAALAARTGRPPLLLTGDAPAAARRAAEEAGVTEVAAGLLPEDKVDRVRALQDGGAHVMMVGDGVNDGPALAAAHTGVAMGRSGSDLSRRTADAVVVRDELGAVAVAVSLARRARRLVVQNLVLAGVFIGALVAWDLFGHLPMPLAVAGHEGSTVIVALNGLRLLGEGAWQRAAAGRGH
ncbi:heavy metal translocating P-type ATPase [Nocardiopsis baichengensis]|uniref:heavy metal translocating P-type ATPase n=1 Tax=Nocardiopsis baichengensis TaxID=280240 RepID=UPI00034A87FB|nr:heavy metal translocating P-type ATPase [Nocardiopsis baichengensis]WNB50043.1 heavy metal translocating P-type ATPase [Nocardiopsis baichengensis]